MTFRTANEPLLDSESTLNDMDTNSEALHDTQFLQLQELEEEQYSTTEIKLNKLDATNYRSLKKRLYTITESANNLGIKITVENLEVIRQDSVSCTHFMQSCNREQSLFSDLFMILTSIQSSTQGSRVHKIVIS